MPKPLPSLQAALKIHDRLQPSGHITLALGMVLLIGVLVASYMQVSVGIETMHQHEVTANHAEHMQEFENEMQEAQAITRAYALTRDMGYLETLGQSFESIGSLRQTLKNDLAGSTEVDTTDFLPKADVALNDLKAVVERIHAGETVTRERLDDNSALMRAYRQASNTIQSTLLRINVDRVQQSIRQFELTRFAIVFLAVAALLLLLVAVVQKHKRQQLIERLDQMLRNENQKLENQVEVRTQELTQLATYLTTLQEREKHNLARELHDELGALLTAAKMDADWVERKLPPESREAMADRLNRLRQNLIGGITLKRRITNGLRPALLHDLGLVQALNALVEEYRQGGDIDVVLDLPEAAFDISEEKGLSLYRIVQEALTNIRKYAQARQVRISLYQEGATLRLRIEDDGIGFDPHSPKLARHGLAGIKHRVLTHGGQLDIQTAPGQGVRILATLPV